MTDADLLAQAAVALRDLSATLKIYGSPIAPVDLERLALGGTQDRREELLRLSSNQLNDPVIFMRLIFDFLQGCKAQKYPKGLPIELMGRTIGAPITQKLVGMGLDRGPKAATGLQRAGGGASFKPTSGSLAERVFCSIVAKVLVEQGGKMQPTAFVAHAHEVERVAKSLDAVMIQRLLRDTLRTTPVTAALGVDALRLLSPLADALELALASVFLDALMSEAKAALFKDVIALRSAELAAHLAKAGRVLSDDLAAIDTLQGSREEMLRPCAPNVEGAVGVHDRLRAAAALALGVDLNVPGGFASAVYRRVMVLPRESKQAAGLVALGALLDALVAIAAAAIPQAFAQASAPAAGKSEWPALKPEELMLTADRVLNGLAKPKEALPGGLSGARSPAKMLLTLRGDWVARTQMLALAKAAMREGSPLDATQRTNVGRLHDFLGNITAEQRTELMKGLYQMATGDPDQRTRQIGLYFLAEAAAVLRPGLTLGPLRVWFAKYWRAIEVG